MSAVRTQVYLSTEQRRRIDHLTARDGTTLAEVIRRALDLYLDQFDPDPTQALADTFGVDPAIEAPDRDEWARA